MKRTIVNLRLSRAFMQAWDLLCFWLPAALQPVFSIKNVCLVETFTFPLKSLGKQIKAILHSLENWPQRTISRWEPMESQPKVYMDMQTTNYTNPLINLCSRCGAVFKTFPLEMTRNSLLSNYYKYSMQPSIKIYYDISFLEGIHGTL